MVQLKMVVQCTYTSLESCLFCRCNAGYIADAPWLLPFLAHSCNTVSQNYHWKRLTQNQISKRSSKNVLIGNDQWKMYLDTSELILAIWSSLSFSAILMSLVTGPNLCRAVSRGSQTLGPSSWMYLLQLRRSSTT